MRIKLALSICAVGAFFGLATQGQDQGQDLAGFGQPASDEKAKEKAESPLAGINAVGAGLSAAAAEKKAKAAHEAVKKDPGNKAKQAEFEKQEARARQYRRNQARYRGEKVKDK